MPKPQRFILRCGEVPNPEHEGRLKVVGKIMALGPGNHEVIIRDWKVRRSTSQNALFHAWCKNVADSTGYSSEEVKWLMKAKFLGTKRVTVLGESFNRPNQTSSLNTEEFSELLDRMNAWAAGFGIALEEIYRPSQVQA